ncbi:hypothetical protein Tco_0713082 [Tanacetum coccineum]
MSEIRASYLCTSSYGVVCRECGNKGTVLGLYRLVASASAKETSVAFERFSMSELPRQEFGSGFDNAVLLWCPWNCLLGEGKDVSTLS